MRILLVLGVISLVGLFLGLGSTDFADDREARDVAVARETLGRGETLVPLLGGTPTLTKPWLGYAHEMLALRLGDSTPAASRAIRGGLAVLLVALVGLLGARHLGGRPGLAACAVLATTLALPLAARTDGVQILATLLGWVGAACFADVLLRRPSTLLLALAYVSLALCFLVAGPWSALWPVAGVLLGLLWSGAWSQWRALGLAHGLIAMVALALPWYAAMAGRFGSGFFSQAVAFPYAEPASGPWYAGLARMLGFLVVGFYPWTALLPEAALRTVRWGLPFDLVAILTSDRRAGAATPAVRIEPLLLGWLVAGAIALPLLPAAPLSAALPAIPAAALLVGRALDRVFAGDPQWTPLTAQASLLIGVTGTAGAVLLTVVAPRLPDAMPALRTLGTFILVSSWLPFAATLRRLPAAAVALMAVPVALGAPLVFLRTLPALEGYLSTRSAAQAFDATAPPGTTLVVVGDPPASLRLNVHAKLLEPPNLKRALQEQRARDGYAYVAFPTRRESEVARAASPAPIEILIRAPAMGLARVPELR